MLDSIIWLSAFSAWFSHYKAGTVLAFGCVYSLALQLFAPHTTEISILFIFDEAINFSISHRNNGTPF